jgi:NAD-dependent deacetylase
MKKLVVLTGAGISAESGLRTFRDMNGLWEEYNVMDVASYDGWMRNPELVLNFYNQRRQQLQTAQPNAGHKGLADLEQYFDVHIVTQNVDNLHERAGSSHVLHLHGELTKVHSCKNENDVTDIGYNDIHLGDKCKLGGQLRPHIVWFGEAVPEMEHAIKIAEQADVMAVIGTSLNVYPAAGLVNYVKPGTPIYLIDPNDVPAGRLRNLTVIKEPASVGVDKMKQLLLEKFKA